MRLVPFRYLPGRHGCSLGKGQSAKPWFGLLLTGVLFAAVISVSPAQPEGLGFNEQVFSWVEAKYGVEARRRMESLQQLVVTYRDADEREKLRQVNDFFNEIPYQLDEALWQERDYWATPIELLGAQGGDCEDYSIGKYFTLREMGVSAQRLRITYVKAIKLKQSHMVLAYYPTDDADPLILDNLNQQILPAEQRKDLVPVYSFNGEGLWLAVGRSQGKKVGGSSGRVRLWDDLRNRMEREFKKNIR